jgi:hypothetical protein
MKTIKRIIVCLMCGLMLVGTIVAISNFTAKEAQAKAAVWKDLYLVGSTYYCFSDGQACVEVFPPSH